MKRNRKTLYLTIFLVIGSFLFGYFVRPIKPFKNIFDLKKAINYQSITDEDFIPSNSDQEKFIGPVVEEDNIAIPEELFSIIIEFYCGDFTPDYGECDKTVKDKNQFNVHVQDMNKDGKQEFILMPFIIYGEMIRGADGGGEILVFQIQENKWKKIGEFFGDGYTILETTTNGYSDIKIHDRIWAGAGTETIYRWQKDLVGEFSYEPIFAKWYRLRE